MVQELFGFLLAVATLAAILACISGLTDRGRMPPRRRERKDSSIRDH